MTPIACLSFRRVVLRVSSYCFEYRDCLRRRCCVDFLRAFLLILLHTVFLVLWPSKGDVGSCVRPFRALQCLPCCVWVLVQAPVGLSSLLSLRRLLSGLCRTFPEAAMRALLHRKGCVPNCVCVRVFVCRLSTSFFSLSPLPLPLLVFTFVSLVSAGADLDTSPLKSVISVFAVCARSSDGPLPPAAVTDIHAVTQVIPPDCLSLSRVRFVRMLCSAMSTPRYYVSDYVSVFVTVSTIAMLSPCFVCAIRLKLRTTHYQVYLAVSQLVCKSAISCSCSDQREGEIRISSSFVGREVSCELNVSISTSPPRSLPNSVCVRERAGSVAASQANC